MRAHRPQPSPRALRRLHFWGLAAWLAMIPVSIATGLLSSVEFVAGASIYANAVGHWSAWQGSRAEEEAE